MPAKFVHHESLVGFILIPANLHYPEQFGILRSCRRDFLIMQLRPELEYLQPFPPDELPELAGDWEQRELSIEHHKFRVIRPANPDALLDTAETLAAHEADGYMPYWGYLWPTAFDMGLEVLNSDLPKGLPTLEIGAGIGFAGLAGLSKGIDVVFSDYDRTSVRLALTNAVLNGFPDAQGVFLDWRHPPATQFPLILGCDIIYERANHAPIIGLLDVMLAPEGEAWFADPGRHQADEFVELDKSRNYEVSRRQVPRQPYVTRPDGVTDIWILQKKSSASV